MTTYAATAAEMRRSYRAARTVRTAPNRIEALRSRLAIAEATLAGTLNAAGTDKLIVPGFAVWRDPAGYLHVQPVAPRDAAQLALWREIAQEEPA